MHISLLQICRSLANCCYAKESLGFGLFAYAIRSPPARSPISVSISISISVSVAAFRHIAVSTVINKSMLIKASSHKRRAHNAGAYYTLFN